MHLAPRFSCGLLLILGAMSVDAATGPRARDLGVPFDGTTGPLNAITDVAGVAVGHTTLIEGAAVRTTVAAKARTIRERMSADSEVAAAAVTERMSLPSVLLVLGFLLFICFPAIVAMTQLTG